MALTQKQFVLETEHHTEALAINIAPLLRRGDTLLLHGEIGSGKSTFARAIIRARLGRFEDVPSPTFTIVQTYQDGALEIWHCDLYRLSNPDEAIELGLEIAFDEAICLIEWPDRLGTLIPQNALNINFEARETDHFIEISCTASWSERLVVLNE